MIRPILTRGVDVRPPSPNGGNQRPCPVDLIVMHATAGAFTGALQTLTDSEAKVSAHYLVGKDGRCLQLMPEDKVAWHAGGSTWRGQGNVNSRSIGIELENLQDGKDAFTEAQLGVAMWLTLRACRAYKLEAAGVVAHGWLDPVRRVDPEGFPWGGFLHDLALHLLQCAPLEGPAGA